MLSDDDEIDLRKIEGYFVTEMVSNLEYTLVPLKLTKKREKIGVIRLINL